MTIAQHRAWILGRKLKNIENETQTMYDLKNCEKHWKTRKRKHKQYMTCKMTRNTKKHEKWKIAHCVIWNMLRNPKNVQNEKDTLWNLIYVENTETPKNVEIEKCTLCEWEYGEKPEKRVKWDKNTVWPGLWQETLNILEKWEIHTLGLGVWWENRKKTWKIIKNSNFTTWNMARNPKKRGKREMVTLGPGLWRKNCAEKRGKWEMHTVRPGIWRENRKKRGKWDTNNVWPGTWQETLTNVENEKCTL